MKHENMSSAWTFSTDPFGAYRADLVYGRNKRDRQFLPVKDVTPVTTYTVTTGKNVLFCGTDKAAAEKAKADFDAAQENCWTRADLKVSHPTLPEGKFRVIKTKEKGTILIVPGDDNTNRCLLFVGCKGGFRGGVDILGEATTGSVLMSCSAGNKCESSIEAVVLLAEGQSIGFHAYGRRTNQVEVHTWNGTGLESKTWSKQEWDRRNDPARGEDNVRWWPGAFRVVSLIGNAVSDGVSLNGEAELSPCGMLAHGLGFGAGASVVTSCRIGRDMHDELVLAPAAEEEVEEERTMVLVHEYSPGSGAKRWPSFKIDWGNAGPIERLGRVSRSKGSGGDTYTLIIAPRDWASNIAGQFINERDYRSQTLSYKPGHNPSESESDLPRDLVIAFSGDEGRAREFVAKVAALPTADLDGHILCCCGRARVKAHLEEVSGDPGFFLGADPNRVSGFVADFHLNGKYRDLAPNE